MSRRRVPRNQQLDETIWEDYWSPVAAYQMQADEMWPTSDDDDDWIELADEIDFEGIGDGDQFDDEDDDGDETAERDLDVEVRRRPARRR